mmetsp:Transcript_38830/g.76394  ORF Transcript_38830/g.76394 Transcript_38830/m.76394 type:complete len:233 (+) Transcript_38830:3-701(+)
MRSELARFLTGFLAVARKTLNGSNKQPRNDGTLFTATELEELSQCDVDARPYLLITWTRSLIATAAQKGYLALPCVGLLDNNISQLLADFETCKRIKRYNMPFPYAQMVKIAISLYLLVAPFAFVVDVKYGTPVANFFLSILLFGVDEIGVEIEEPFGKDPNDLTLKPIWQNVEVAVASVLSNKNRSPYSLHLCHSGCNESVFISSPSKSRSAKAINSDAMGGSLTQPLIND